jgi:hypothetical protein
MQNTVAHVHEYFIYHLKINTLLRFKPLLMKKKNI